MKIKAIANVLGASLPQNTDLETMSSVVFQISFGPYVILFKYTNNDF